MKIIYRAENVIDANLVKGLLEQDGIMAFVNGSYLQGGMGELPVGGLITVSVAEADIDGARRVIERFDAATSEQTPADDRQTTGDDPDWVTV